MRFAYHDLYPQHFESVVVVICHDLLGPGVQEFATGPDGGRDAKFVGTAQMFPSTASPLSGNFIIQAKHTTNPIGKFSDSDFSGDSDSSTLTQEYPRIRALVAAGEVDHYLLFANRRLAADTNEHVCELIRRECGLSSVFLVGVEALERYVKRIPAACSELQNFEYELPLRASPDELAEVILALAKNRSLLNVAPTGTVSVEERIRFQTKNTINGLSKEYADGITRNYLRDFAVVKAFLEDPANYHINAQYRDAAAEFEAKLVVHRSDFENYDRLLNYLLELLIERDGDLRSNKRLTRTVFYFMYWSCDIGKPQGAS